MAFESYKGSIKLGAGLTPASEGYPLIQACDVQVKEDGTNLEEYIANGEFGGGSIEVTDVIEEGSKLPVTSGAVYEVFKFLEEI